MRVDIALEPELDAGQLAELAVLAEQNGIHTIWVTNDPQARNLFMLFMKSAELTRRIRLGVMAISPFEIHPLTLSVALQTLNEASKGRAAIVVGGAGAIQVHVDLDLSRRVRAVRECIEVLKDTRADQALNFEGEIYPVRRFQPRWAVEPPPTVLAGANVDQMLRMSARRADGVHMSDMPLPLVPAVVEKISTSLAEHGRSPDDFEFNNFWAFHVKEDRQQAELEARSRLILRGMLNRMYIDPFLGGSDVQLVRDNIRSFYKPFYDRAGFYAGDGSFDNIPEPVADTLVQNLSLTASTSELDDKLEVLHDFARAGLTHITLGLHDDPADAIRVIGERVIPALA
jgi:alkanesulfonate monooxygenase SsuD/methylene tetrahydromethanopterin reductase-like flavin-dependent oxidoreductase (luciferase family)